MNRKKVYTRFSALALVLSMGMGALEIPGTLPVLAQENTSAQRTAVQNVDISWPNFDARPGYDRVVIDLNRAEGDDSIYTLWRAAEGEEIFVQVAEFSPQTDRWIDTDVDPETQYDYQLQKDGQNSTATTVLTGKQSFLNTAEIGEELSSVTFDGTHTEDLSEQIDKIKNLNKGSIYIRFKTDEGSDASLKLLLSFFNSDDPESANGMFSSQKVMYWGLDNNKIRANLVSGFRASGGSSYGDGEWHEMIFTSDPDGIEYYACVDGHDAGSFDNAAGAGLFTRLTSADTLMAGGYQNGDTMLNGFKGQISHLAISSEYLLPAQAKAITMSEDEAKLSQFREDMFNLNETGHTWLFVGGQETAGDFAHLGQLRNYVSQYEEYIRWTQTRLMEGSDLQRQIIGYSRFVANGARRGNTIQDVAEQITDQQTKLKAKAVCFMPGIEDVQSRSLVEGDQALIDWNLDYFSSLDALLSGVINSSTGQYLVLQTPHAYKDETLNQSAEAIAQLIRSFASNRQESGDPVVLVDTYNATNTDSFKNNGLDDDNLLNAQGHYEVSRHLSLATTGTNSFEYSESNFTAHTPVKKPEYTSLAQEAKALEASFIGDAIEVTLADETLLGQSAWTLKADNGEETISMPANAGQTLFVPAKDGEWKLTLISQDNTIECPSLIISKGETSARLRSPRLTEDELSENQKKLRDLLNAKDEITWMFMGDSITHGCRHTRGYDAIANAFEKFVHDQGGLDRPKDQIINTAVSGAIARDTLSEPHLSARIKTYQPDVVIIMLGMNDCVNVTPDQFEEQLKQNIEYVKETNPDVQIILRTCNTVAGRSNMQNMVQKVRDVAAEGNYILVDHAKTWDDAVLRQTNVRQGGTGNLNSDALHPNGNGQKVMFNDLLKGLGLFDESNEQCRLEYKLNLSEQTSANTLQPSAAVGSLDVDLSTLLNTGQTAGTAKVSVTADGITWTKTYDRADSSDSLQMHFENLPIGKEARVHVEISMVDQAVIVTYPEAVVEILSEVEPANIVFSAAKGGYAQASLNFENPTSARVSILRCESENGTYEEIGASTSNTYMDLSAEPEKTYFYKLQWSDNEIHTSEVKQVKTGMDAYKEQSAVYKPLKGEKFDGTKLIDISEESDSVKALASGSLFFRFKTDVSQEMSLLYGKEAGTTTNLIQTGGGNSGHASIALRPLSGNLSLRPELSHTRADGTTASLADGQWHNVVIVCHPGTSHTYCWYIDGQMVKEFDGASNAGFFSTIPALNQLTIGGYYNGTDTSTVVSGFQGEIRDVIFSEEYMSTDASRQITASEYIDTPDTPEPVVLNKELLQTVVNLANGLNGDYSNKDAAFDALLAQSQNVLDNAKTQEEIDQAADALNTKLLSLRKRVSKDALSALK